MLLAGAILFVGIVTAAAAGAVVFRAVEMSCLEAMHYTGRKKGERSEKKKKEKRREKDGEKYMEGTTGNPPYGVAESFSDPRQADMDGSFTVSWT